MAETTETMKLFEGPGFLLQIPSGWLVTAAPDVQAAFVGPRIGGARVGVVITLGSAAAVTSAQAYANQLRERQADKLPRYTVINESDLSRSEYEAFQRQFHWYNSEIDMTIFQRQLFIRVDERFYMLTATQPNSDRRTELDRLFVTIFNSFRLGHFELP